MQSQNLSSTWCSPYSKIEGRCPFQMSVLLYWLIKGYNKPHSVNDLVFQNFFNTSSHSVIYNILQFAGLQLHHLCNLTIWKQFWRDQHVSGNSNLIHYIHALMPKNIHAFNALKPFGKLSLENRQQVIQQGVHLMMLNQHIIQNQKVLP